MNIFNIFKANDRITELEANQAEWNKKYTDKVNELVELQKQYESKVDAITNHEKLMAEAKATADKDKQDLVKGHEEAIQALNKQLEEAKTSASKVACQTVASLGVPEGTVKELPSDQVAENKNVIWHKQ